MPLAALARQPARPLGAERRARAPPPGRSSSPAASAGLGAAAEGEIVLTVPPQILVGIGLALVLSALTETALGGPRPAGDPRRLDDLRPPRRRRHRPARADADLHRRHRRAAPRRDRRRHRGGPRLAGRPAAEDRPGAADRRPPRRGEGQGADDRPGLRAAARRSRANAPRSSSCRTNCRTSSTAAPPTPSAPRS